MTPPPPAGDALWEGNDPATGTVQVNYCNGDPQYQFAATGAAAPAAPPPPPPPDPADLAEQARAQLQLPDPTLGRSPSLDNGDPARGGQPYTLVNLWTRYYTDPAAFVPVSKTVAVQGVSATATATPRALTFDPGDGSAPVSCPGPGRPWRSSDGFDAPGSGECGYQYTDVQAEPVTATVSIQWDVVWTGTGGTGGTFNDITTSASSEFLVEQIQIVVN